MSTSAISNMEPSVNKRGSSKNENHKEILDTSNNNKRKTDVSESHMKTTDKSPSRNEEKKDRGGVNVSEMSVNDKRGIASPNISSKRAKSRASVGIGQSGNSKKSLKNVTFKDKNFLDVVNVESYKKYNVDMSYNEPEHEETTRCKCLIY
jgi:hypothetical protein